MASSENPFLTLEEVANLLRTPAKTLYSWRYERKGPPAFKVGKKLLYPRARLLEWIDSQMAEQNSDRQPG